MNQVQELSGTRVFLLDQGGPALATTQDFLDVIGALWGEAPDVRCVAIPVSRIASEFFELRTGLAGEALQKFVNYRVRLAVVGDISQHVAASSALSDFVRESNEGQHVWFCATADELRERLASVRQ